MRHWVPTFALLVLLPAATAAQLQPAVTYDEKLSARRSVDGLTPAENRELMAAVDRLAELLRNSPGVREGVPGSCVRLYSEVPMFVQGAVPQVGIGVGLRPVMEGRCPQLWSSIFWVYINHIVQPAWPAFTDEEGPVHQLYYETPGGGPHLDFVIRDQRFIVMPRTGKPAYQPVPRERFLRWHAAVLRRQLASSANSHPDLPPQWRQNLDRIETALRTWPAATLAAPGCAAYEIQDVLAPDGGCSRNPRLVTYTPLDFDTTLSRGAVQVITVVTRYEARARPGTPADEAVTKIWQGLDLHALAALLR
jgi:hypothetical protein